MTRPTLSDRNIAIIRLIARGHSNAEIGDALNVSVDTIKTHLRRIFERTHARNRAHLIAIAYDEGILEPGASNPTPKLRSVA